MYSEILIHLNLNKNNYALNSILIIHSATVIISLIFYICRIPMFIRLLAPF